MIMNLENQDTSISNENYSLNVGDQSENNIFLENLSLDDIVDIKSADGEEEEDEPEEDEPEEEEDEDGDGIDDETENINQRLIEVEYSEDEAQIESELHSGNIKDKIAIKLQAEDEGLRIKVDYSKDIKNNDYDLEFEFLFSTLVEFIDDNNDSIFTIIMIQFLLMMNKTHFYMKSH